MKSREAETKKRMKRIAKIDRKEYSHELVTPAMWCVTLLAYQCKTCLILHNSRQRSRQRQSKTYPAKAGAENAARLPN